MGVVRMAIDVAEWARQPASVPAAGVAPFDVSSLAWGEERSRAIVAAVASACGLRPEGFLAELTSRPGRVVHGWEAVMLPEKVFGSVPAEDKPQTGLAGVILLLESTPSGPGSGSPRFSIPWLLVRPESRRCGMGRALVAAALGNSRGLKATRVTIDTLDRWPEAVAFWRGVGFRRA